MQGWLENFESRNPGYLMDIWSSSSGSMVSHTEDIHVAHLISVLSGEEARITITPAAWRRFRQGMGWKGTSQHQDNYNPTQHTPF